MIVEICSLSDKNKWLKYLEQIDISARDIYFTPEYYSIYEKNNDGKARCFIFEKEGQIAVYPFLINSINEIGYDLGYNYFDIQGAYGYNGVISTCCDNWFKGSFYNKFREYCNDSKIIAEFTRFHPLIKNENFSRGFLDIFFNRSIVTIDLKQELSGIWTNSFTPSNRNKIRKAKKKEYRIINSKDNYHLDAFEKIYSETMKKVHADRYYYFRRNYFENIAKLSDYESLFLFVKNPENEILATTIILMYGEYANYHLSASSEQNKENSVINFLLHECIRFLKERNLHYFNLGGGATTEKNDKLLKFKMNFSRELADFSIGKKIYNHVIYKQVIKQWEQKHPQFYDANYQKLLGYRTVC